jgi:ATP phosphoribosyltransferase regulatory subunit HisZ
MADISKREYDGLKDIADNLYRKYDIDAIHLGSVILIDIGTLRLSAYYTGGLFTIYLSTVKLHTIIVSDIYKYVASLKDWFISFQYEVDETDKGGL